MSKHDDLIQALHDEFVRALTVDSRTRDGRRKEFNQAIFDPIQGYAIFNGTDLETVMAKFNRAARIVRAREALRAVKKL